MGCTASIYDNPEITQKQTELQMRKSTNGIKPSPNQTSAPNRPNSIHSSRLKRAKVAPLTHLGLEIAPLINNGTAGRTSPAYSDKTDKTETNRSIKRVAFYDEPQIESRLTLGSPIEMKRARKRRERNLRKRLLNKMGEAELMSERLLAESERLSLTSSMSRTTSRTGSSFPYRRHECDGDDDNVTEVTAFEPSTPREENDLNSNIEISVSSQGHATADRFPPVIANSEETATPCNSKLQGDCDPL